MPLVVNIICVGLILTCSSRVGAGETSPGSDSVSVAPMSQAPANVAAIEGFLEVGRIGQMADTLQLLPVSAGVSASIGSSEWQKLSGSRSRTSTGKSSRLQDSRRRWLYVSAGLTVTAAVVATWSKQKADRSYDRYLTSANLETQRDQFDRAERFDRISGVAFAAMEAGVLFTTYFVFF